MQIEWWTLALQAINFLVLVWLLQRFLFRPIKQVIAKRRAREQEAMEAATRAEAGAEAAKQRYEDDRAALEQERQAVMKDAHEAVEAERTKILKAAMEETEKQRTAALDALEDERQRVLEALRGDVAKTAVGLAAALLAQSGARMDQAETLKGLIRRIKEMPPEEQERIRRDMKQSRGGPRIVTAAPLEAGEKSEWENAVKQALEGAPNGLSFETAPELLGGAEIHFPHSVLRFSWQDHLAALEEGLRANDPASQ